MANKYLKLSIAHLYPELFNLYGDIGNVITLKKRCEWFGIDVEIKEIHIGEHIGHNDMYYLGAAINNYPFEVVERIVKDKDMFLAERNDNAIFLGIQSGYQIFCNYYIDRNNEKHAGLGLLDAYTKQDNKRVTGNVTLRTDLITPNTLVGFENHTDKTFLQGNTKPLGHVIVGNGNNSEDKTEGAYYKNVFGTYLHGAFLPKNIAFADYLIQLALKKHYNEEISLRTLNDTIENKAHEVLVGKSY